MAKNPAKVYCSSRCSAFHSQCKNCGKAIHKSAELCKSCLRVVVIGTRVCKREGCQNEFEITRPKIRKRFCSHYCTVREPCIDCGSLAKKAKGRPTRCISCGCKNQRKYSQVKNCQVCSEPFVCSSSGDKRCTRCSHHRFTGCCADCDKPVTSNSERCHRCNMIWRKKNGLPVGKVKQYPDVIYPCDYCGRDFIINGGGYRARRKTQDRFYCSSDCGYADKRDIFGRSASRRHNLYHRPVQPIGMHRSTMLNSNDGKCWYCLRAPSTDLHHVRARSRGGSDHWTNLFPLCEECHLSFFESSFEKEIKYFEWLVRFHIDNHRPLSDWFQKNDDRDISKETQLPPVTEAFAFLEAFGCEFDEVHGGVTDVREYPDEPGRRSGQHYFTGFFTRYPYGAPIFSRPLSISCNACHRLLDLTVTPPQMQPGRWAPKNRSRFEVGNVYPLCSSCHQASVTTGLNEWMQTDVLNIRREWNYDHGKTWYGSGRLAH